MQALTIGEVAKRAAVHIETLRYYERQGLVARPPRSRSISTKFACPSNNACRLRRYRSQPSLPKRLLDGDSTSTQVTSSRSVASA